VQPKRILAVSLLASLSACLPIPHRVRDTPKLIGQLTDAGRPLSGARLAILPLTGLKGAEPSCEAAPIHVTADGSGEFSSEPHERRRFVRFLLGESPEWQRRWWLCLEEPSPTGGARWRVLYKTISNGWDSVHLTCDLSHPWTQGYNDAEGLCRELPVIETGATSTAPTQSQ
jgi:hypothetical protein